jgi:hypothetical protein
VVEAAPHCPLADSLIRRNLLLVKPGGRKSTVTTILRATAKCPKCGCHDFASPREAPLDADITCLECGYICTVKQALDAEFAERRRASSSTQ